MSSNVLIKKRLQPFSCLKSSPVSVSILVKTQTPNNGVPDCLLKVTDTGLVHGLERTCAVAGVVAAITQGMCRPGRPGSAAACWVQKIVTWRGSHPQSCRHRALTLTPGGR